MDIPVLLLINKIDLGEQEAIKEHIAHWQELIPRAEIHPISALHGFNLDHLLRAHCCSFPLPPPSSQRTK